MNTVASNQSVVSARGLRKAYKNKLALDNTSLHIEPGQIIGLIPFEGELRVLGRDPRTERDALMNDVCFIADVAVLPRWIRVREAIEFVAGVHPRFDRARCERFLANTQLKPHMKVRELSKGMIVQLHLALVMAIDAKLLVLDEPTLGLAPLMVERIFEVIAGLKAQGLTILLVEQNVHHALALVDRAYVMETGRITLDGAADVLRHDPKVEQSYLGVGGVAL